MNELEAILENDGIDDVGECRWAAEEAAFDAEMSLLTDPCYQTWESACKLLPATVGMEEWNPLTDNTKAYRVALEAITDTFSIYPTVREEDGTVVVSGIPANQLMKWIKKYWGTARINKNMFGDAGRRYLTFPSFYAVEFAYMLEEMLNKVSMQYKSTLQVVLEGMFDNTWLKSTRSNATLNFNYDKLKIFNYQPLPPQRQFFEHVEEAIPRFNLRGYMLGADPGTGKTYMGYAIKEIGEFDIMIAIVPKNAVDEVWVKDAKKHYKKVPKVWTSLQNRPIKSDDRLIICHYDYLPKVLTELGKLCKKHKALIWLDESHNFNELKRIRTQVLIEVCQGNMANGLNFFASGTPFKAMGTEAIPLEYCIDPLFNDDVAGSFSKIFGSSRAYAVDILANRIGINMFKIDKLDVVVNEKITHEVKISIPNGNDYTLDSISKKMLAFIKERIGDYRLAMPDIEAKFTNLLLKYREDITKLAGKKGFDLYLANVDRMHRKFNPLADRDDVVWCKQFERECILPILLPEDKRLFNEVSSPYKYVSLVIRGEALGRVLGGSRIECFLDMIPHTPFNEFIDGARKKTLIFTSYVDVLKGIIDECGLNYKPLSVYGDNNSEIVATMKRFNQVKEANPLVATYNSLSTAVPVVAASTGVMYNMPMRDYIWKQAVARFDRLGQDGAVTIIKVLLDTGEEPNISTRSNELMEWSKDMVDAMIAEAFTAKSA